MYFLKLRLQPHLMYTGLRMYRPDLPDGFHNFLISAKKSTYAGSDDETSLPNPLLDQSMQLEFREGDWLYRDIYYGMSFFSGIEVVYLSGKPLWSMTYSGGTPLGTDSQETRRVYKFLRAALSDLPTNFPVRGPASFSNGVYDYKMGFKGDLTGFSGNEMIQTGNTELYSLTFSGGLLR